MRPETKAKYPKNWREISTRLKELRGYFCENCRTPGFPGNPLTVHHIDYEPGNNSFDNLIILCAMCHLRRQQKEKRYGRFSPGSLLLFS